MKNMIRSFGCMVGVAAFALSACAVDVEPGAPREGEAVGVSAEELSGFTGVIERGDYLFVNQKVYSVGSPGTELEFAL